MLPDNSLMFGYDKSDNQPMLATINPTNCEITIQQGTTYQIAANKPYNDIEALAACLPPVLPQSCPPEITDTDWMYVKDSFNDATGLTELEIYGMAIKQTGDTIIVAINANMGAAGKNNLPARVLGPDKVVDGHVGFSELVFDFNGNKYAVHFSSDNDSAVINLGLYTNVILKDVTKENYGYTNLKSYKNAVGNKGSMGDLLFPTLNGYFDLNTERSVPMSIASGVKVTDDNYQPLTANELATLGLNFATGLNTNQLGTDTFGFSFTKTPEMVGQFTAYFFTECINDGIAIIRELPGC